MNEQHSDRPDREFRIAVVLHPDLEPGAAANVTGVVVGGLQSDAFRPPIRDADGNSHSAICHNLVVLKAKTANQLLALLAAAAGEPAVRCVAFSRYGQTLSNRFAEYAAELPLRPSTDLGMVGAAVFGPAEIVRPMTRAFSLYR